MGSLYVFDLDGTLARNEWRSFLIKQDPPDWYEYHEASKYDVPYQPMVELACSLAWNTGNYVELWTARPKAHREVTLGWLSRWDIPFDRLLMRADGDRRRAHLVKLDWLHEAAQQWYDNIMVWEDSTNTVKAMQEHGLDRAMICQVNHRED